MKRQVEGNWNKLNFANVNQFLIRKAGTQETANKSLMDASLPIFLVPN